MLGFVAQSAMSRTTPAIPLSESADSRSSTALTEDAAVAALRRTWQPVANAVDLAPGRIVGYTLLGTQSSDCPFRRWSITRCGYGLPAQRRTTLGRLHPRRRTDVSVSWLAIRCTRRVQSIPSLVEPNPDKLRSRICAAMRSRNATDRLGETGSGGHALPHIRNSKIPRGPTVGPPPRLRGVSPRSGELPRHVAFRLRPRDDPWNRRRSRIPPCRSRRTRTASKWTRRFPRSTRRTRAGKLQSAHHRRQRCWLPNFTTIRQTFTDGDERVLVHIPSPNTASAAPSSGRSRSRQDSEGRRGRTNRIRGARARRRSADVRVAGPSEVPINPARGGWGVLVTPGDTLANTFQKHFRQWLTPA